MKGKYHKWVILVPSIGSVGRSSHRRAACHMVETEKRDESPSWAASGTGCCQRGSAPSAAVAGRQRAHCPPAGQRAPRPPQPPQRGRGAGDRTGCTACWGAQACAGPVPCTVSPNGR